mgnify:CR=1 FL=1
MNSSATSPALSVPASSTGNPLATRALVVGVIGLVIAVLGLFMGPASDPGRPLIGYLIGFSFWFAMAIGMLLLIIMFYLFDAGWPIVIRRQLEHALSAIPWLALCFVPLLLFALGVFGPDKQGLLWRWLNPSQEAIGRPALTIGQDPSYLAKHLYLSLPFFLIRLAIYLAVLWGLSNRFRKHSYAMDTAPDASHVIACRKYAGFGAFAVPLTLTFAAFDFFMSLSYAWYSTMYGVWFFATCMRAGIAGAIILAHYQSQKPGQILYGLYNRAHQYILGCLALTFTVFYAYVTFCQYFLIYNADVPEETFWFNMRELNANWTHSSWWWVSLAIIFFYFFFPFFCLLSYHLKVSRRLLHLVSFWVLGFLFLDLYFNILPGLLPDSNPANPLHYQVREFVPQIWDFASLIGVGGVCIWAYLRAQSKAEVIPIHDPRIAESLNYHE